MIAGVIDIESNATDPAPETVVRDRAAPAAWAKHHLQRELDAQVGLIAAQLHVLEAQLVDVLARFDAVDGWQGGGYRSMAQWLSVRGGFSLTEARRLAQVAERAHVLPTLLAEAEQGRCSVGVVAAAARVVTPENEERVAEIVRTCTPAQSARVLATYRSVAPVPGGAAADGPTLAPVDPPTPAAAELWWRTWTDDHGRHRIDGALDRTTGELLEQARLAIVAASERDAPARGSTGADFGAEGRVPPRRVTAPESIGLLASAVLEHADRLGVRDRGGERFAVQVVCDIETLAEALGLTFDRTRPVRVGARAYLPRTGAHLSNDELARLACEGTLQILVDADGEPLFLGTEVRLFSRQQRRALRHRAGGAVACCEFPGCTVTRFVQAHHILGVHDDDGPTDLDNGVLLCSFHHHELHRRRWRVERSGTQLTFWDGTRCLGSSGPPGPAPGPPSDLARLPQLDRPPDPPPGIGPATTLSPGSADRLTTFGLDVLVTHLLGAAAS